MSIADIIASDPKLDDEQTAEFLGVKRQTLAVWRSTGRVNLPYLKIGRAIRYRFSDLEKFVAENTVGASSATA